MEAEPATAWAVAGLAAAFLLVALMGLAIQRGTTCLVAAITEMVTERTAHRTRAIVLAGLWAGAISGHAMPALATTPTVPATALTVAGALLLGIGALINRACVVGTVARIGAGEWAFLFTPLGIFAAGFAFQGVPLPTAGGFAPARPTAPLVTTLLLALLLAPTLLTLLRAGRTAPSVLRSLLLSPHAVTAAIGILFALLVLLGSPWSYADALIHLARTGMADQPVLNLALVATLLASARLGGRAAGLQMRRSQRPADCARAFAGGGLMATGALLVPGSNDSLLLHSAPMLSPNALVALPVMALTIAIGQLLRHRLRAMRQMRAGRG
jgi:toxin CptA